MLNALGFDFETHLIGPDRCPCGEVHGQFPPAVCMSWAYFREDGSIASDVVTPAEGLAVLDECLDDPTCHLVGAETAFDVMVSCVASDDFDRWIARWVKAYDEHRVHDVLVRQKLLHLAAGTYRWERHSNGKAFRIKYGLDTVSRQLTARELSKPTKETAATHPRLRYAEVDGVPIRDWPVDFVEYAREDAVATIEDFFEQENWREGRWGSVIEELWGNLEVLPWALTGDERAVPDPFADIHEQTFHALWLKCMAAEGLITDPIALERFERHVRREYVALCAEVRGYGLARREYWRDLTRMRAEKNRYANHQEWKRLKAELDLDIPEAEAVWHELHDAGLVKSRHVKNMNAARKRMFDVCFGKHKQIPHTDKWEPDTDDVDAKIAIDSDSCRLSEDPSLIAYAELTHTAKMLTTDIKQLRRGIDGEIHTHYEVCLETGRTSSAGPNVQNRARGEGKEVKLRDGSTRPGRPGDRECFIPRAGNVLIDCDYPQLELYCLAQVCKWALGYSTLGEALTADWTDHEGKVRHGKDPHTDFARKIVAAEPGAPLFSYEEAERIIKHDKKHPFYQALKNARDAAKGCNFGKPGGLGAETMVSYAAKSYGVIRNQDQWRDLFVLWDQQWIEMPAYFEFINGLEHPEGLPVGALGSFCVPQMWSGRLRAGATYCAACNSFYQGLGADVAKRAGAYIFRACYVKGVDDELFGCTPVNFVHDQMFVEAPEERAQAAALRVEHWMRQAAIDLLPDYGPMMASKTEAILCRRWSKNAEAVRDGHGNLVPWEDERLLIDDTFDEEETEEKAA